MDLSGKKIVVTGGAGFLGRVLVAKLQERGAGEVLVPRKKNYDFTSAEAAARLYAEHQPDMVFHLAAEVGGIGANKENPGRFFFANMAMGLHLIEEGRKAGLKKFLQVGTICEYPKHCPVPFKESDLWQGYPEETNAPYGIAKKALGTMLEAYADQYGFNGINILPVNLYGPHDNFDPGSSHVIPALIVKFINAVKAGERQVEIWGTGKVSREFLYVDDCAEGLVLAAEKLKGAAPINLGTGAEISIAELASLVGRLCAYEGELVYNSNQPDGQPRRRLDISLAQKKLGFSAKVALEEGLKKTIAWYKTQKV